jgi:hypothetical protein
MTYEKRKFVRFDISLDLKFKPKREASDYSSGITRNFSRKGFSFESQDLNLTPHNILDFEIKHPQEDMYISVMGNIAWKKQAEDKYLVGINLLDIQNEIKWDILDYAYNRWVVAERS